MKTRRNYIIVLCVLLVSLVSCRDNRSIKTLDFPTTPVISANDRYALVLEPYIALRDEPGEKGITMSHVRRGEVYEVTGKKIIDAGQSARSRVPTVWVRIGDGWCVVSSVELYSSREKAVTASSRFNEASQ
jgi:hypothetical protein